MFFVPFLFGAIGGATAGYVFGHNEAKAAAPCTPAIPTVPVPGMPGVPPGVPGVPPGVPGVPTSLPALPSDCMAIVNGLPEPTPSVIKNAIAAGDKATIKDFSNKLRFGATFAAEPAKTNSLKLADCLDAISG